MLERLTWNVVDLPPLICCKRRKSNTTIGVVDVNDQAEVFIASDLLTTLVTLEDCLLHFYCAIGFLIRPTLLS